MTRIKYVFKELSRNLYRNPATTLGSLLSLALLFLLFDIFWVAAKTSDQLYSQVISQVEMEVFVPEETPDSLTTFLTGELALLKGVTKVTYVSREEARQELAALVGLDLLVGYDSLNPLPRSFRLNLSESILNTVAMDSLSKTVSRITQANSVIYSEDWLSKAEQTRSMFQKVGMTLGIIILLTALVSSTNNIRLLARVRNIELRQMLMIGSGKLFATMPFLLEGMLFGGLAAGAGWFGIIHAHRRIDFSQFTIILPTQDEMILFCLVCAFIGAMSGFLGARRLLR